MMPVRRLSFRIVNTILMIAALAVSITAASTGWMRGELFSSLAPTYSPFRSQTFVSPQATQVFADNFSTGLSDTWTLTGVIGTSLWSVERQGVDWGARRSATTQQLELTNDTSGTGNAIGWAFANVPFTSVNSPYSGTLSANPGLVTWQFNMRQIRADPSGFGAINNYGAGFILTTNTTAPNTGAGKTGYAVVFGEELPTDPVKLVRFSGGLQGTTTITPIITSNTTGLTDIGADYLSVRVTYNPSTNEWQLFVRNDGLTAFADPSTGTLVSQGTAVDNTYVNTAFTHMGAYWQGSTGANQTAFFDNVSVAVNSPVISVTGGPLSFGNQAVNTTSNTLNLTVTNNGDADLVLGTPTFATGTQFSFVTNPNGTVVPLGGGQTTIAFKFTPTSVGAKSDTVTINSNAPGSPPNISLTGTGVGVPVMTTSQTSLAFAERQMGTTSTAQSFTISNTGTGDLSYNIGATGDVDQFVITGTLSGTIAPGGSTQIDVQFAPTAPLGAKSATLTISGDDPANGSDTVTLTGTANSVGQFTLSSATYQANENAGVMQITVNRNNGTLGTVNATVNWGSGTAVGGTDPCVPGQDYIGNSVVLTFLQGDTSKTANIPICDDAVPEDSEVLSVSLSTNLGSVFPTAIAQATILDTDPRTRVVDRLDDSSSADECSANPNDCSLRGAINGSNDGDTITFDPNLFSPPFAPEAAPAAVLTLSGSEIGIFTDITITGPGASLLTIDGNATSRIFGIATGSSVTMSGMTLTNADAGGGSDGGAINQNSGSTLNLNSMVITGNLAAQGGGIYTLQATLNVTNSTISDNETENEGGGIYNAEGNVTITDSIISGNTALYNPQSLQLGGGGIFSGTPNAGSLTITGSTISNNCAGTRAGNVCTTARSQGGGIAATAANISNSLISGNVAIDGAGIYHLRGLIVTNSTVSGNTATGSGGGISSNLSVGAFLTVIGSTFSANSAAVNGGGIYLAGYDTSSIRNSTFSANTAATGGNLWILPVTSSSVTSSTFSGGTVHNDGGFQLPVSNSIFAASCTGTDIVNVGFNIDSGTGCGFGSANNSMSSTDALLGPLQNNGGPTFTMAILPGSPAIDAGSAFGLTTDQRGLTRPINHASVPNAGDGSDIGAFEMQVPTAASASISGRVTTAHGTGIKGVIVTVQGMSGTSRVAYTNTLGYYRIEGLAAGEMFVVSVNARRQEFAAPTQVVNLFDSVEGLNFRALP